MSQFTSDPHIRNLSPATPLHAVVQARLSRRATLHGGLASLLGLLGGCGGGSHHAAQELPAPPEGLKLGFGSLPASMLDACVVPPGYRATVLGAWGTPLDAQASAWRSDGGNSAMDALHSTGMHHDGMHYFPLDGSSEEGILVLNHEYIDPRHLHPDGPLARPDGKRPPEEVRKEINAHGISTMHIRKQEGMWHIVPDARHNRRLTSATSMRLAGPVAGSHWVQTPFSPDGSRVRGTNNNCGNGSTPWGTYLSAEENWAACFVHRGTVPDAQKRVGVATESGRYRWEQAAADMEAAQSGEFARFDITPTGAHALEDWRNEANGFGYMVEIDPYDPGSPAVKRTALGRFAHEAAAYAPPVPGQPLAFYCGDDARFEYVYRFVSAEPWDAADARTENRIATGDKYLDHGTLSVARFDEDGTGQWLPLVPSARTQDGRTLGEVFGTLDAILVHTRSAADLLGATPMDRPEWTAVHPLHGDVYLTLTNNSRRTLENVNAANPRADNVAGHIVRWHDTPESGRFVWDIFVFGSHAHAGQDVNRSALTQENQFASPDGLAFDARGILWIQTDNSIDGGRNNAVAQSINDQMLATIPGALPQPGAGHAAPVDLRRFFVGPNAAEITGFAFTPDHRTIFLNIQHPENWPAYDSQDATRAPAGKVRPRSATVVIQKIDGTPVGE